MSKWQLRPGWTAPLWPSQVRQCPARLQHLTFVELIPEKAERIRSALLNYRTSPGIPKLNNQCHALGASSRSNWAVSDGWAGGSCSQTTSSFRQPFVGGAAWEEICVWAYLGRRLLIAKTTFSLILARSPMPTMSWQPGEETERQKQAAKFLFNLLVPNSFHEEFARKDPIVIECDNRTAQLHWEMMVIPHLEAIRTAGSEFLGMHPTITRQFRNSFVVPPEPPPRFDHILRVLIVADTDEERRLAASQEEGQTIDDAL